MDNNTLASILNRLEALEKDNVQLKADNNKLQNIISNQEKEIKDLKNNVNNVEEQVEQNTNTLETINKKKSNDLSLNKIQNNKFFTLDETLQSDKELDVETRINNNITQLEKIRNHLSSIKQSDLPKEGLPQFQSNNSTFNKVTTFLPIGQSALNKSNEYRKEFYKKYCDLGIEVLHNINTQYKNNNIEQKFSEAEYHKALDALEKNMQNISTNKDVYDIVTSFFKIIDDQQKSINNKIESASKETSIALVSGIPDLITEQRSVKENKNAKIKEIGKEYNTSIEMTKKILMGDFLFTENTINSIKKQDAVIRFINNQKHELMKDLQSDLVKSIQNLDKKYIVGAAIVATALIASGGIAIAAVGGTAAIAAGLGISTTVLNGAIGTTASATTNIVTTTMDASKQLTTGYRTTNLMQSLEEMQKLWDGQRIIENKHEQNPAQKILNPTINPDIHETLATIGSKMNLNPQNNINNDEPPQYNKLGERQNSNEPPRYGKWTEKHKENQGRNSDSESMSF